MTDQFYDHLAPFYSLIYPDWEQAITQQAQQLTSLIQHTWDPTVTTILDVAYGIGTQSLGLAAQGYQVTGSDLSAGAIRRAQAEAHHRGLSVHFSVCDMRQADHHHTQKMFDVVICCDNALPHLLTDADILQALRALYACTRPGGGCLISLRDYDCEPRGRGIVKCYGTRETADQRYVLLQVWDFHGDLYDLDFYCIETDRRSAQTTTQVLRSRYYAISPNHLITLMTQAGFVDVRRHDDVFFQPVVTGTRPATSAVSPVDD